MSPFVSPVPNQPFPQTEDCATVCYIVALSRMGDLFNILHVTQQSTFLLNVSVRRLSSSSTVLAHEQDNAYRIYSIEHCPRMNAAPSRALSEINTALE